VREREGYAAPAAEPSDFVPPETSTPCSAVPPPRIVTSRVEGCGDLLLPKLPKRGVEILRRVANGEKLDAISRSLGLSDSCGAMTMTRMRAAFGAESTPQLVAIAMRRGLIS